MSEEEGEEPFSPPHVTDDEDTIDPSYERDYYDNADSIKEVKTQPKKEEPKKIETPKKEEPKKEEPKKDEKKPEAKKEESPKKE